jgi:hypothetical protein
MPAPVVVAGRETLASGFSSENPEKKDAAFDSASDNSPVTEDAQDGVKKVEAIASVWTRKELYFAYAGYVYITHVTLSDLETDSQFTESS